MSYLEDWVPTQGLRELQVQREPLLPLGAPTEGRRGSKPLEADAQTAVAADLGSLEDRPEEEGTRTLVDSIPAERAVVGSMNHAGEPAPPLPAPWAAAAAHARGSSYNSCQSKAIVPVEIGYKTYKTVFFFILV